ncbi:phage baseplate protein [Aggregatibacter actinomycetemcomitans]|uniref:phage baseplate protein n=1 Tax=Aggregatibacter actinomycetemcomitans TaxID=714 RepID=UPI001E4D4471|nr:tail length tape measure protein [Aggregatibacter actinomycetemcomitans]
MLLNELLIKIGFDADSQAMQQFEQLLNTLEQGANGAAEQLGDFAKAIEDVAKEAFEQAKGMPEFSEFFKSLDDLQEKTKDLSQDEALDAWVKKILESDELLSGFGQDFNTNAQELEQGLVSLGLSSENVEKVIAKLKDAIEQKEKATNNDTESTQENTEAQKENAESAGNLADKMIALWATKYGADGLIQKFELLGISISKTTLKFAAFAAAFYAATIGVKNFVYNNLGALDKIKQLSAVTGEAADQIYKLGKVAEVNGSSSQAVQSSIEGLSRVIGEAASGIGRGAKYFEQYGLSAKKANGDVKTSSEILGEISDKMKKMGEQEQIAMLAKLGIDGSMIQLLRLGNDELRKQIELADKLTLGVGNAENAKTAAAFKDNMTQLTQVFTAMGEYLSLRIAPAISRIIERFTKWFSENNDLIKAILNGFGRVFSFLFELAGAIDNVVSNTIGWRTVIYTLGAALLWLSRRMILAFATNPIGLAIMAIAGLILIIDDFITWLQGGESAFGEPINIEANITTNQNPIESGAAIADHAVIQPKQVTINGIMVDQDHGAFGLNAGYIGNIRGGIDFLNNLPLPRKVVTQTAQAIAKVGRIVTIAASPGLNATDQTRKLAPWLPDFSVMHLLGNSLGDSRVQKCYADLVACQKSGETISAAAAYMMSPLHCAAARFSVFPA